MNKRAKRDLCSTCVADDEAQKKKLSVENSSEITWTAECFNWTIYDKCDVISLKATLSNSTLIPDWRLDSDFSFSLTLRLSLILVVRLSAFAPHVNDDANDTENHMKATMWK